MSPTALTTGSTAIACSLVPKASTAHAKAASTNARDIKRRIPDRQQSIALRP